MIYAQPLIRPGKWDAQTSLAIWDTNGSHNLGLTTKPRDSQKKKKKKGKKRENLSNSKLKRLCRPLGKLQRKWKEK